MIVSITIPQPIGYPQGHPGLRDQAGDEQLRVLMVWDHLFGTYQAERGDLAIRYGLVHPRSSPANPVVIAYEGVIDLVRGVVRAGGWRDRLLRVFGPP